MSLLQKKLAEIFPAQKKEIAEFVKTHGDKTVSKVTLAQAYGGMRGVVGIVCDSSEVPPDKGLVIRGKELYKLTDKMPEEIIWLLLSGELPNKAELEDLISEINSRQGVPDYIWKVMETLPKDSHPMTMLNTGIVAMQRESVFAKRYDEGMGKEEYWIATLEDALNIIAKLPELAAGIYRMRFDKGDRIAPLKDADLGKNLAHMLGLPDPNGELTSLMRLYITTHSDHEGGNVSAFASAIINSALSDLYYALSGGLNGLAGPLHGLANQECLGWILELMEQHGGKTPTEEELTKFTWDTLNSGKVVPGYGHAVLRITDPRFEALLEFGKKHMPDDPVFLTVERVFNVVPEALKQVKKIKDPWPNVDAASGSLLYHYGLKEFSFYTVMFSIARGMGIAAQAVLARAMGFPIIRPKSLPTSGFKEMLGV
jgi:citrate synthase